MKKYPSTAVATLIMLLALSLLGCSLGTLLPGQEAPTNSDSTAGTTPLVQSDDSENDFWIPPENGSRRPSAGAPAKVLVLMYHNFTTLSVPGLYDRTLADFENDLIYLRDNNITVISLGEMLRIQRGELVPPPGNLAVITIDDGYETAYTRAFPLLKKYQAKATFFLITSFVGNQGRLTWAQVQEMSRYRITNNVAGFDSNLASFGSHSVDHNSLAWDPVIFASRTAYQKFLNMELNQSRKAILSQITQSEMFLSLPYGAGAYDADIINAAKRYNYNGIRTSEFGTLWGAFNIRTVDNYAIPSLPIFGDTPITTVMEHFDYLVF